MKTKLSNVWERLRSSYWFLPGVMAVISLALSFAMIEIDDRFDFKPTKGLEWIYKNRPDGAREVLSTIASSMITVAGVVFSVTIVGLSMASSQFGPHVLRSFMRDRGNQIVLGTFVSTFLYSLMVLRTIRSGDEDKFVPQTALLFSVLLALASIGVLIYFLHHSAESIQGPSIIDRLAKDLNQSIGKVFPEKLGEGDRETGRAALRIRELLPRDFKSRRKPVVAIKEGHIQAIENETLMKVAIQSDILIFVTARPGAFVTHDDVLAYAWPGERLGEKVARKLCGAFLIGATRTAEQDVGMPASQLTEIAVRSLSTGINDPQTAMDCIVRLGAGFRKLAGRAVPSPDRYDEQKNLRVLVEPTCLPELIDNSFDQILQSSRSNSTILRCLLKTLAEMAQHVRRDEDRVVVRKWAANIRACKTNLPGESRTEIEAQFRETMWRVSQMSD